MLLIRRSTLDWLLEGNNPPVRYLTMKHLSDASYSASELKKAASAINSYGPISEILEARADFIPGENGKYTPYKKYQGIYWQLMFLSDMNALPDDSRVKECCDAVIELQKDSGGFPYNNSKGVLPCLTGNQLRALTTLGYSDHPAVKKGFDFLAKTICNSEGVSCFVITSSVYPTCFMTIPRTLKAFNEYPYTDDDKNLSRARDILKEKLYGAKVYRYVNSNAKVFQDAMKLFFTNKKSSTAERKKFKEKFLRNNPGVGYQEKTSWKRLAFPLHYNPNILEALDVLTDTGDIRLDMLFESLEILFEKKTRNDRWNMESTLNGKMIADIEQKGQASKWITYHALSVFKKAAGLKFMKESEKRDEIFD